MNLLQYRQPNRTSLMSFCPQFLPCLLSLSVSLLRSSCGIIENNVSKDTHASPQLGNDSNSILLSTAYRDHIIHYSLSLSLSLSLSVTCPAATLFCSVKPPTKPPRLLCEQLMHRAEKLIERKTDPWECLFVRPPQAAASVLPRRILSTVQHGEYLLYALL